MNGSSIQYESLESTAGNLEKYAGTMADCLERVKGYLNQVGEDGVWSGDAANSVRAEFDSLVTKFSLYDTAVKNCAAYLREVYANYKSVDAKIQQGLGK